MDTRYYYRIRTVDQAGLPGVWLSMTPASVVPLPLAPAAPWDLSSRTGSGTVHLEWKAPTANADGSTPLADLDGYWLYYDTDSAEPPFEGTGADEGNSPIWIPAGGSVMTYDLTDLPVDDETRQYYHVAVVAVDTVGNESALGAFPASWPRMARWVQQSPGSGQYATISAALSGADKGTTVMVGPGVYAENSLKIGLREFGLDSWNVTVESERGPGETVIDGASAPGSMLIEVADGCEVIGFTIRNVRNSGSQRAIDCVFGEDVLIANNVFIANDVGLAAGGLVTDSSVTMIVNNVFHGNALALLVPGQSCGDNHVKIFNNIFLGNTTGIDIGWTPYIMGSNAFQGNSTSLIEYGSARSVSSVCSPSFLNTSPPHPNAYRLPSGSGCIDAGEDQLTQPWWDCDGSEPDVGAFGGPHAYRTDCVAPAGSPFGVSMLRDGPPRRIDLSARYPLGGSLTYGVSRAPVHGTISGTAPALTYTVDPGYVGTDEFTYKVYAWGQASPETAVAITVKETNAAPTAPPQVIKALPTHDLKQVTLTGEDPDGDALAFTVDSLPLAGHLITEHTPQIYYAAPEGFLGAVSFTYHAEDGIAQSAPATVTIVVNNDPVIAAAYPEEDFVEIPEDGSELFSLQVSDADGEAQQISCSWSLDGSPVGGSGCSYGFNPASVPPGGGPFALRVVAADGLGSVERSWTVVVRETVVLDNATCAFTSTWSTSTSGSGYLGTNYRSHVAGSGAGTATWTAALPMPGTYRVYARWPAASGNDTTAIYRITYAGGSDDVSVDQTQNGGQWNLLGTYAFATAAEVRLETGNNEVAVADAVRLEWTPDPADIVLDDLGGVPVGSWTTVSGGFGGTCQTAPAGTGARTFTWTPAAVAAGTWDLYARWKTVTGGATNAKYVVAYSDGRNFQVTVDQTVSGGRWVLLGSWGFAEGDAPRIVLNDIAGGTVVADAVKLVWRGAEISTIVDNDADADFDAGAGEPPDLFGWSGSWVARTSVPGFIGAAYRQIGAGSGGSAQWLLPIAEAGTYELYARWTSGSDRTTKARYEIEHNGQVGTVVVSQQSGGGQWQYLGRFEFDGLGAESVRLKQSADNLAIADAVMFARTDEALPIIVDNTDGAELFWNELGWNVPGSLITGYWGSNYVQTPTVGLTAAWTPQLPVAGNYDISARWTAGTDRTATAQYTVFHGEGEQTTVGKSQRTNGGAWVGLGRYYQPAGEAVVELASQSDGITVADAMRFDYTVLPPPIVVDNADAAAPDFLSILAGTWAAGTSLTGYYATDYLARAAGTGASVVRWTPTLPLRGYYTVHAWWPTTNSNFATNAPFRIVHAEAPGGVTRTVNQQANGGKWNYLGTFLFDAGEQGYVELSDAANGRVAADAVRFSPEGR